MTPRSVYIVRMRGELPYAVIVNRACWGLFRTFQGALLYMGQALGVPRRETLALLREMEVGER